METALLLFAFSLMGVLFMLVIKLREERTGRKSIICRILKKGDSISRGVFGWIRKHVTKNLLYRIGVFVEYITDRTFHVFHRDHR